MCGLFGWQLSDEALAQLSLEAMAALLMARNEMRGRDSWGVVAYDGGQKMRMMKQVGPILKSRNIKRILSKQVMGHTRKATSGTVNEANAHPFDMGRIVGCHNGMVSNHFELKKKYNRTFEVDSQHILAHINDDLPLTDIDGYGIVTYIDKNKPSEVLLGLGGSGELAIAGIGSPKATIGVVWSSTSVALEDALDVSGVAKYYNIKTESNKLYKVSGYDIFDNGKFGLKNIVRTYPASYDDSAYSDHLYKGRMIGFTNLDKKDQKKTKHLSRKQRKRLSKAFRGLKDAVIAGKRALLPDHTTTTPVLLSTFHPSTPGYV